jgi:hypothetical protein
MVLIKQHHTRHPMDCLAFPVEKGTGRQCIIDVVASQDINPGADDWNETTHRARIYFCRFSIHMCTLTVDWASATALTRW